MPAGKARSTHVFTAMLDNGTVVEKLPFVTVTFEAAGTSILPPMFSVQPRSTVPLYGAFDVLVAVPLTVIVWLGLVSLLR